MSKKQTVVDRVLGFFNLAKRSNATVYTGAQGTRLTLDWIATILSADQEIRGNLRLLRARGRELSRNNPIAKNYLNLLAANVIGHKGIGYKPQVRNNDGKLASDINARIEDAWLEWSERGNCTVDGKFSLRQLADLAVRNVATDGEMFVRKIGAFQNKYRFALQAIDADQCDHLYSVPPQITRATNEIRLGIEVDKWGKPLTYWINPGHPSDMGGSLIREGIAAAEMIHLFDPARISQTRGVTWFHPVMLQLRMLEGYIEAELVAARTGAAKMGWLYWESPEGFEPPNDDKKIVFEANPGTIETLPPGLKFQEWSPDHPANAFPNFVVTILRQVATGLGVSYNALASDLIGVNYSSMRSGLLIERDQWKRAQSWMIESFYQPIFRDWLKYALISGELKLDSRDPAKFLAGKWEPRGWQWVDPLKDVQSAILALAAKLTTRDKVVAEFGEDIEEIFEGLKEENELAKEFDLDLTLPGSIKPPNTVESSGSDEEEGGDSKEEKPSKSDGRTIPAYSAATPITARPQ